MNIVGTGLSGLVGSRVVDLFGPSFSFENYSLETGVDITNAKDIRSRIAKSSAPWMFHFAAFTNVQEAEKQRDLGEHSLVWRINVQATETIVQACKESGKRVVYIDTDYAFDGTKKAYTEEDSPNPQGWYAITKTEGAKRVLAYDKGLVLRISNPYRANPIGKTDFVHKMLERFEAGEDLFAATDQLFVPTFIDDLAIALKILLSTRAAGIYHVVACDAISPFDAATIVAQTYGYNVHTIKKTSFDAFFKHRAPVPQYAALRSEKLNKLGVTTHSFREGIEEVCRQEYKRNGHIQP